MNTEFEKFEKKIEVNFKDKNLLIKAFTHRSYLNEHRGEGLEHNERIEFLGDAVLELSATHFLFNKYPNKAEGELTSYRSALVNTVNLSKIANKLAINDLLLLSRGEAKDTGRARTIILADAVEALIGAIYLDQGYEVASRFIKKFILDASDIDKIVKDKLWLDAKSRFQEKAQEKDGITPTYKLIKDSGPDHDKVFTVGVYIGTNQIATGTGQSKQEAEQMAAENAIELKGW